MVFLAALYQLDAWARRLVLVPASTPARQVEELFASSEVEAIISDRGDVRGVRAVASFRTLASRSLSTETALMTSGTTGTPKVVVHTIPGLTRTVARTPNVGARWGLLYDPARFAGLQVVFEALLRGDALILPDITEPLEHQVKKLLDEDCTHLSATPSLWRRLLMAPATPSLPLQQITLGGEPADQAILNALRRTFPAARITHVYASTEAGVGFSVQDGRAGFPRHYLDDAPGAVQLKVVDGMLWLRPPDGAAGRGAAVVTDEAGYVRSGDLIDVTNDRIEFLGRESGIINVGGFKVHPERVEAVILSVPGVAMARVSGRVNAVLGQIVTAEVVPATDVAELDALKIAVKDRCSTTLERPAQPAIIRLVDDLAVSPAGKVVRS